MGLFPLLLVCVGVFVMVYVLVQMQRIPQRARERVLTRCGLKIARRLRRRDRRAKFEPYEHLAQTLYSGGAAIRWWAEGERDGHRLEMFFHSVVVAQLTGLRSKEHTVAGAECPDTWPEVLLIPKGIGTKLMERFGTAAPLELELPEFNARWRVLTPDHDFALMLLTPETQRVLASGTKHETWHIGSGRVTMLRAERVGNARALAEMVDRVAAVRAQAPDELEYYVSPGA